MRWYRAFQMSDDGTTVTMKNGVRLAAGSSTSPNTLTAGQRGTNAYYTSSATSDTVYARYHYLAGTGIGAEFIGGRDKVVLSAAAGNAHGNHSSVEVKNTGYVSGLCTGVRGNIVFSTDTAVANGTYYGVMAELYPAGNTSALPAGSNACLGLNIQSGTALDLVGNFISFSGADASTKGIYTHNPGNTFQGSIKILVNGVKKWLYFAGAE
jgi:hypothetical protein